MAAIGEIRKRSGLVLIIIGAAIVAFVLSDLLKSNRSLFREGPKNAVGVVNEEKITIKEFRQEVQQMKTRYQQRRRTKELNDRILASIQNDAWDQMVFDKLFKAEQDALALRVTNKEISDFIEVNDPHPSVRRLFTDQSGQYNKQNFRRFKQQIKQGLPSQASQRQVEQLQKRKEQWIELEQNLARQRERSKFFNLIKKSFHVTDLEAEKQFMNKNEVASINFVSLQKRSVADSAVTVTDNAMQEYYNNNKSDYKTDASRSLEYVIFDVIPTTSDSTAIFNSLKALKVEFEKRDRDSSFVDLQSDEPFDSTYLAAGDISEKIRDSVLSGDSNDVFGPYLGEKGFEIAKLIDTKPTSQTYFKASHILFKPGGSTKEDTSQAEQQAKEVFEKINQGADFEEMSAKHNDDPATGKEGRLGWFPGDKMVPAFTEALKQHEKGDVFTVNTQFGTHIIKMTAKPVAKAFQLGTVVREIYPSEKTYEEVYAKANEFRSKVNSPKEFDNAVRKAGLNKRVAEDVKPSKRIIPGLENAPELVRWAYSNKEGSLSGILELSDQYVVAHLSEVSKKGVQPLEDVSSEVRAKVLEQKKKDKILNRLKTANESANSLSEIAQEVNEQVQQAPNIKFSQTMIPGLGNENTVVGTAFGLEPNQVSNPFKGDKGVYQIKLTNLQSPELPKRLASTKESLRGKLARNAEKKVREAMKDNAKIRDMRYRFN